MFGLRPIGAYPLGGLLTLPVPPPPGVIDLTGTFSPAAPPLAGAPLPAVLSGAVAAPQGLAGAPGLPVLSGLSQSLVLAGEPTAVIALAGSLSIVGLAANNLPTVLTGAPAASTLSGSIAAAGVSGATTDQELEGQL